jgi:hypothetical protein
MSDDDLLSDVWKVLANSIGTGVADRELLQLRQRWGGSWNYVKKLPRASKVAPFGAEIASGAKVKDAARSIGVSRATGYRLAKLKTWRR